MKKIPALMLSVLLVLSVFSAVAETSINVSGSGEVLVNADYAIVTLGVVSVQKDVMKAQNAVNSAINKIRSALIESGVQKEDINTDQIRIRANYDYSDSQEKITGYNVSSTLSILTKDMDNVGAIIDLAFENGANTLNGIDFYAENTDEARKEALTLAVSDARMKAEAIAAAAGLKITGIERISESYSYTQESAKNAVFSADAETMGAATIVQSAKLTVQASVNIEFIAE